MLFVFFVVPETKGRSLEELDELFQAKVPAWRSASFKATGVGAQITSVENIAPGVSVSVHGKWHSVLEGAEAEAEAGSNDVEKEAVGPVKF